MEWDDEAAAYLESYLAQVRRVGGERGDDVAHTERLVRERIESLASAEGASVASIDLWHRVVRALGTPESVVAHLGPPPLPPGGRWVEVEPLPVIRVRRQISRGKLIALNVFLVLFLMVVGTMISRWIPDPATTMGVEMANRFTCKMQLTMLYEEFEQYSGEHDGAMPPLPPYLNAASAIPNGNPAFFRCPASNALYTSTDDTVEFSGPDYVYLGYELRRAEDLDALATAYRNCHGDDQAVTALGSISGERSVALLRADIEKPSTVPLIVEKVTNHFPRGGHVLYLDGHVEYVELGEKFPMTEASIYRLREMEFIWLAAHSPSR